MSGALLDASALLALHGNEPGAEIVAQTLPGAHIGAVNLEEVIGKLAIRGMPEDEIDVVVSQVALLVHPLTEDLAFRSGLLRPLTDRFGLSLGDRTALALSQQLEIPVYTTDSVWGEVGNVLGITVRLIR